MSLSCFLFGLELSRSFVSEGVRHMEVFFDPQAHTDRGVAFSDVVQGLYEAFSSASKALRFSFKLIMCIVRDKPVESAARCLEEAVPFKSLIEAVGLDSDEIDHPPSKFTSIFMKARELGFRTVAHGGHDGPAEPYVWELLRCLNVERIDHGISCVEDEKLMTELKKREIPITVCPISNVKIGPIKS
jgi:adenosine deaminase